MDTTDIACRLLSDDDGGVPVCLTMNAWQFWNSKSSWAEGTNLFDDGSELVCDRRCGPSDYHAEWRRYGMEDYRLLISYHDHPGLRRDPGSSGGILVIARAESIGEVAAYCATRMHPSSPPAGGPPSR